MRAQKKILIIDDEPDNVTIMRYILEYHRFDVITATDGQKGIKEAITNLPDLIILDLMLEQLTGIDVLREIRKDKGWGSQVKIVVLSGLTYITNMEEVKKLSTRFVPKSDFEMNSLIDLIKKLLV